MSQFENIFKVTADGGIEINKPEVRDHAILKAFTGNTVEAKKDLMYIYLMGHPKSMYSHLDLDEKDLRSRKHIGRDGLWLPSPKLKGAIAAYAECVALTPTGNSFLAATKSLSETGNDINDIIDTNRYLKSLLNKRVKTLQSDDLGTDETLLAIKECKALTSDILDNQKKANDIIKQLPVLIKTVESLASSWADEGNGRREVHGGGELGNRE